MSDKTGFTPEDLARVVRWVILLFFAILLLDNLPRFGGGGSPPPKPVTPVSAEHTADKSDSKDCTGNVFNTFSMFAVPLFPITSASVGIADIKKGSGEPAACGQRATLRYTYATRGGDIIFSNMKTGDVTKDVVIGGREMLPGFERGLIGMQPGGERDISIPPALGFSATTKSTLRDNDKFKFTDTSSTLTARASLLSLSPTLPSTPFKLRVVEQTIGDGIPVECGDAIQLKLTLWKMDGTSLYTNETGEPLLFHVGKSEMPYGIEQGVIGMMPNGKRTLIIPPSYMAPLDPEAENQKLADVKWPKDEIVLAIVEVVPSSKDTLLKAAAFPATPASSIAPANDATEEKK